MIATLNGRIQNRSVDSVILDVNGVGYELHVSGQTRDKLPETGQSCFLFVQTIVREDAIALYGFVDVEEKQLFLQLISVSGVGPKLALTILSGLGAADLRQALQLKDLTRLTKISGIGKKTAQRLCMELAEKMGTLQGEGQECSAQPVGGGMDDVLTDAVSALVNLGYTQTVAWQALRTVQKQLAADAEPLRVEELIRKALQALATT